MQLLARRRSARRGRPDADDGFALVATVLTMAMLAAFSLVVLQQTLSGTTTARKDQDWVAALGAAQAGLDDYLSRLNESNGSYYVYTTANPDPANPAMGTTSAGVPNWAPVPTAGGEAPRAHFHYDVDSIGYTGSSTVSPNGNIVVESTGRVGTRSRTLTATVRRSGFIDYVYFTDYETTDPLAYANPAGRGVCEAYYGIRPSSTATPVPCDDIAFSNDTLSGPVHSNDTMLICDSVVFKDTVTTASGPIAANGGKHYRVDGCGTAGTAGTTFQRSGDPAPVGKVALPSTNLSLKRETSAAASPRGCLYVGPTKVVIKGSQIKVDSPWTRTVTPGCAKGTYFPVPRNGVVYVDRVPADDTSDINSWQDSDVGQPTCSTTPYAQGANKVGYPIANETDWLYPCKAGDVFIEQEGGLAANGLDGRLTVSANNNLYVTNHIDYATGAAGGSFLGLIAEQFLYVWHPVNPSTSPPSNLPLPDTGAPFTDARISAALLSVNHAFIVQNVNRGTGLGTLTVNGAITQKFRGAVRVLLSSGVLTGYAKDYRYDARLRYDAPPKFLNPLVSSFSAVRTAEGEPKYR